MIVLNFFKYINGCNKTTAFVQDEHKFNRNFNSSKMVKSSKSNTIKNYNLYENVTALQKNTTQFLCCTFTDPFTSQLSGLVAPIDLYTYYNVPLVNGLPTVNGSLGGTGKTIAIISAPPVASYTTNLITNDYIEFCTITNLPVGNFIIHQIPNPTPAETEGWGSELCLDTQYAHALAPGATIMLVISTSPTTGAMAEAIEYAIANGANIISMSWGLLESAGDFFLETVFNNGSHSDITFIAASGDTGATVSYPSSSPNVISVGGTTLPYYSMNEPSYDSAIGTLDSTKNEVAWLFAGGGRSSVFAPHPAQQSVFVSPYRQTPDISMNANPFTGVGVICSESGTQSLFAVGGTSASAPCWAGICALLSQNDNTWSGTHNVFSKLYNTIYTSASLRDSCLKVIDDSLTVDTTKDVAITYYMTSENYNLATGLGSPNVESLLNV